MKKALKVMALIVLAGAMLFAAGCKKSTGTLVGYVCNNFNDTFQGYIMENFRAYFEGKDQYKLEFQDSQEDVIKQQDQVNNLINKGAKAIVIVPVNTNAVDPIIAACSKAKVPLIMVNRSPYNDANKPPAGVYYIGSVSVDAGRFQGDLMKKLLGGKGGVAILLGKLDNEATAERTRGNKESLAGTSIQILAEEAGDWQRDQGMTKTENWLTAYGNKLNGILANNDEMAIGAYQALKAKGRTDVVVMGVDLIPDAKTAIANGELAASVLQDATGQGKGSAEYAEKLITGASLPAISWVPYVLVTKDNLAQYQ
ncbi:rhizopine-binding protein [Spirochaetia bacterium]|nr:rhizopine-binding protein [Spirochaetia bacterium]